MSDINDLNMGEIKGGSVHLDAQTVLRLKQYRNDHQQVNPGQPLPGVAQVVRHAVNAWLDENGFAVTEGEK
ncbi:hypothetical protein C7387_2807 [Yokenella regensburgei]|uniref:Uncharacterized protein n=1 Tax=Yokenella regensburgei TaxID=158877 RepID=A0ABX9S0L8_9ENTR|nr:hypothetical protein [Yokenella regensburgei]RKR54641.1 hypothetical protein C7387_2807 [Yokenella regensburgei]VFS25287.1 Uncharacterised protein [Yokenella regensburgei]